MDEHGRRKFRSQTFDNMDRWKSRGGKSQRREEKKREDQRRERVRRKKMQVREKVAKSRFTVLFQWFVAPEGRKVGSLKRRVRSHVARCEKKNCTPLWREAHFQVKMHKKHTRIRPLLEVDTPLWREAHFQVKMHKAHHSRTTFGSWDIEKVHAVVRSAFRSQMCKKHHMLGPVLKVEMWFCVAGARDSAHCQKWAKREGFAAFPKTMAGVGHLKRVWKDAFRVAGAVQETCSSEMLGGQGADFLREVAFWSIRSSGLLRWLCLTGAALRMTWHHFFDAVSSALNFPFLKEVSRNCFVFDVLNFEQWGSLAESLPCWCCQVQIDG